MYIFESYINIRNYLKKNTILIFNAKLTTFLQVLLMIVSNALRVRTQDDIRNKPQRKSERTVIFPVVNETDHQLPVFDPVVDYVGRNYPLAPPVDTYGRPLCATSSEDTFCEKVDYYPE